MPSKYNTISSKIRAEEIEYVKKNYGKITGKVICNHLGWSSSKLERLTRVLGVKSELQQNKKNANIEIIKNLNDPEIIYILGFLWADGYMMFRNGKFGKIYSAVKLQIIKTDYNNIAHNLEKFGKASIYFGQRGKYKPYVSWHILSSEFVNFLNNFDYNKKSLSSPEKIINAIPESMRYYWWRGYFDGDGCITIAGNKRPKINISANYEYDWNFCTKFFPHLQWIIKKHISKRKHKHSLATLNTKHSIEFLNYIYQNKDFEKTKIGLDRKYEKYLQSKSYILKSKKNNNKYIYYIDKIKKWIFSIQKYKIQVLFDNEIEAVKKRNEIIHTLESFDSLQAKMDFAQTLKKKDNHSYRYKI
jgi:hypothetical protein